MSMNVPVVLEGAVKPAANILTPLLTVGNSFNFATVQINACTFGTDGAKIRVAISAATSAENVSELDYIDVDDTLAVGGRYTNSGVLIPGGRTIYVLSSTGDLVFRGVALCHKS